MGTAYNASAYVIISPTGVVSGNPVAGFSAGEIGVGQGFLTNVSSAGSVQFNSNQRVVASNATQFLDVADYTLMKVRLANAQQQAFDIAIGFGDGATDAFDFDFDAPRMPSSESLELFSYIEDQPYTIQFAGELTATKVISLGTALTGTANYSLSLEQFENFDPSVRVYIEDLKTGSYAPFKAGTPYTFANDPSFAGVRFKLHFMAPIASTATGACVDQSNGKVIVSNPNASNPVTATLRSMSGDVIAASAPFAGEHIFQNLPSATYQLQTSYDGVEMIDQTVEVASSGLLSTVSFIASATNISVADAIIEFVASAEGATDYLWNFGDGTVVTGSATPVHAYMTPGIYTVTMTALSGGCSSTAITEIRVTDNVTGIEATSNVDGVRLFPNPTDEAFNIVRNSSEPAYMDLIDVAGKAVMKNVQLVNKVTTINTSDLKAGAYMAIIHTGSSRKVISVVVTH
jgi:PKD repeat protein